MHKNNRMQLIQSRNELSNEIWNACDIMRRDDGTTGVLQYMEQLSWMLFLKAFEAIEDRYKAESALYNKPYERILKGKYRWSSWTKKDANKIIDFVNNKLLPYLCDLSSSPEKLMISTIFKEILYNRMKSPYNLKDVIEIINKIDFNNPVDSHIVSIIYEDLLLRMGREGGVAGEFYTPRPIVRLIVRIINPKIGDKVFDPFCGSSGFLIESFKYMKKSKELTIEDFNTLQYETFYGQEKKPLPYLLGIMNYILHGLLTPKIVRKNTLEENIRNIPEAQRFDVILTNPPFGGKEGKHVQQNFPIQSQATELLAVQYVMKKLKKDGRCVIVVPEGILFRSASFVLVKKELLENYNLQTIISLPPGVFANVTSSGQGPKTNLLFFNKTGNTKEIWYYDFAGYSEDVLKKKYTRANPVMDEDFKDCYDRWNKREISKFSWFNSIEKIEKKDYDLTTRNPNRKKEYEYKSPKILLSEIIDKERKIREILGELYEDINKGKE